MTKIADFRQTLIKHNAKFQKMQKIAKTSNFFRVGASERDKGDRGAWTWQMKVTEIYPCIFQRDKGDNRIYLEKTQLSSPF